MKMYNVAQSKEYSKKFENNFVHLEHDFRGITRSYMDCYLETSTMLSTVIWFFFE